MTLTDQQRAELKALAAKMLDCVPHLQKHNADWFQHAAACCGLGVEGIRALLADLEEAEVELRAERAAADFRNGDIAQLRAELAATRQQLAEAQAYAYEQNAALRCAITQLCDCGRYLPSYDYQHIAEKSTPQDVIDYYLSEAVEQCKRDADLYRYLASNNSAAWESDLIDEYNSALSAKEKSNGD